MAEIKKLKGMRDYDPAKAELLYRIIEKGREIFPLYGFLPLDTPSLERWETLISKDVNAGEEIKQQTYNFKDRGGKHIGLRYDLTVPLIRYIVEHKNTVFPFKRYQIGRVYRYEEAKRSRYREFYQFDLDIIGGRSVLYDAELIKISEDFFNAISIKDSFTFVNNRKCAYDFIVNFLNVKKKDFEKVMRIIDKIDKISLEEFRKNLQEFVKISENEIEEIYHLIKKPFKDASKFVSYFGISDENSFWIYETEEALNLMEVKRYFFSMKIVRGLGYYTDNVFETFIKSAENIGSVGGGGRYNDVFKKILKMEIPAVGYSFGVDRIIDAMLLLSPPPTNIDFYIAYVPEKMKKHAVELKNKIINEGFRCFMIYDYKNLTNQIKHADKMSIKNILIVGEKDWKKGLITYKNLVTGEERKIKKDEIKVLKNVVGRD